MLSMFYKKKITNEELSEARILQRRLSNGPGFTMNYWDDRKRGDLTLVKTIKTNNPQMALVRFMHFIQGLEDKYQICKEDRINEVFSDGWAQFHLNNIDGWHP